MNEIRTFFQNNDEQISNIYEMLEEGKKTKHIDLELIEIIKDLKKKDYKIGLISNWSKVLRGKLADQNIHDLFDEIIISEEVGYQKPQPEIFNITSKKLGIENSEMVFVDDTKRSLKGAETIGYMPLLYINNEKLNKDLSDLL